MKIADSAIQLYSERTYLERNIKRESLTVWQDGSERVVTTENGGKGQKLDPAAQISQLTDKVSLSGEGVQRRYVDLVEPKILAEDKLQADLNMRLLVALFERLTGRKFQMVDPAQAAKEAGAAPVEGSADAPPAEGQDEGFGLIYDYQESSYEYESTEFQASGTIITSDGKEIEFSLSLAMSREFYSEKNIEIRAGDALKDPLVINFDGKAAQLSERNFAFDIDADGTRDQISFVGPGSGFLALDKNGDGIINDGSELFGPKTGNGFNELSRYDSDGNNWIDENDAIYDSLRIWSRNSEGEEQLLALGKVGVGALYLGNLASPFSLKNSNNELLGKVQASGLAVMESGRVVSMQQLDLVA